MQYLRKKNYDLQQMGNSMDIDGFNVFSIAQKVTPNIAFFVPRNTPVDQLSSLGGGRVKVEKNMMNHKIKTMTAYYGDFVDRWFAHQKFILSKCFMAVHCDISSKQYTFSKIKILR